MNCEKKFLSRLTLIVLLSTGIANALVAANPFVGKYAMLFLPVKKLVVYRTAKPLVIDGKANEKAWKQTPWSNLFVAIGGAEKSAPLYQTRVKILWDSRYLYVLAKMQEPQIWAYMNEPDQLIYHENDFELFIDPDGNAQDYFEFEVNARNNLFDLFLPKPYRDGGKPLLAYHALGFKSAVQLDGTLNDPSDRDKYWQLELRIPFEDLRSGEVSVCPNEGDQWRIDFSRVEWQTGIKNGKYVRKKNTIDGHLLPQYNWVWSAPGIVSMHAPERYGLVQFSKKEAGHGKTVFHDRLKDQLSPYLWLIYYKEQDWKKMHGVYTQELNVLGIVNGKSWTPKVNVSLQIESTSVQFTVFLNYKGKLFFSLNNEGWLKGPVNP